MKSLNTSKLYLFPEHDGVIKKQITKILWSEPNSLAWIEKTEVLESALDWCLLLLNDGTWMDGSEFPIKSN